MQFSTTQRMAALTELEGLMIQFNEKGIVMQEAKR
jgi:hypothetical protein